MKLWITFLMVWSLPSWAQEVEQQIVEAAESPIESQQIQAKGKRKRERVQKDAEGTEALGRFEADTVLKSKYHVDGEPLEVDPD